MDDNVVSTRRVWHSVTALRKILATPLFVVLAPINSFLHQVFLFHVPIESDTALSLETTPFVRLLFLKLERGFVPRWVDLEGHFINLTYCISRQKGCRTLSVRDFSWRLLKSTCTWLLAFLVVSGLLVLYSAAKSFFFRVLWFSLFIKSSHWGRHLCSAKQSLDFYQVIIVVNQKEKGVLKPSNLNNDCNRLEWLLTSPLPSLA